MKPWQHILLGNVIGLLVAGVIFFIVIPPKGKPIELIPPPTPSPIFVHVDGAVASPGLYQLSPQSRVQDAIQAAGGLLSTADRNQVNLAGLVFDGQKIFIPILSTSQENQDPPPAENTSLNLKININAAALDELMNLPGIGETKAQAIIQYREENGLFLELEDILNVPGIGEGIFNDLKGLITVK